MRDPARGEVWLVDLGDPLGHEAGFRRPVVVASCDSHNRFGLFSGLPVTRSRRGYPTHVELAAGTSGLGETSYAQVEQVTALSTERLITHLGRVDFLTMHGVERVLRLFFELD